MVDGYTKLKTTLDGYADYLNKLDLAAPKYQPHLVRWVREFLLFAEKHRGYTFEQTMDLFLAQRSARHASPLTTTVYTHPSDQEMSQRLRGLSC